MYISKYYHFKKREEISSDPFSDIDNEVTIDKLKVYFISIKNRC